MKFLLSEIHLVIRRSLANWRLLSTVIVGVIITVALLSSAPLYSNAINDLGLSHALREKSIETLDIHVYTPSYIASYENLYKVQSAIDQQI